MTKTFSIGGIHPSANKLSSKGKIITFAAELSAGDFAALYRALFQEVGIFSYFFSVHLDDFILFGMETVAIVI